MFNRISHQALLLGILGLVFLTRLPALVYRHSIDDEAYYTVVAGEMLHGGLPYQDAVDRKPPLLFSIYWAVYRIAGYPDWSALHLVSLAWVVATMAVLYLIGKRLFTPRTGAVAALLYAAFQHNLLFANAASNGELLMNLPATAALLVAFRPSSARFRVDLLLAGGLVGIAFLIKQPAGIVLLPLGLYCIHPANARTRGLQRVWGWVHGALVAAGFGLTMGLAGLVLWKFHILDAAWYWSVVNHDTVHGPGDAVFWQRALRGAGFWALFCGPLLIGASRALFGAPEIWEGHRAERDALVALLLASVVGVSAGGRFFGHYFIQLIPPLALLAAHPLAESWSRMGEESGRGWRRLTLGWSALSLLVTLGIHTASAVSPPRPSEAATWLRDHAGPGDRLFVWGQYPHLYFLTGLRPASRYISCYPLTGYIFGAPESNDPNFDTSRRITPGAWDSLAVDLLRHPPRFLVDEYAARSRPLYPMQRFPLLDSLVRVHYSIAYRARDGVIYQRGP